jgi:hypothetical protein
MPQRSSKKHSAPTWQVQDFARPGDNFNNFTSAFCRINLRIYQHPTFGKAMAAIFFAGGEGAAVLTASVILLIMDLDRPRRGLVKVAQQSILEGPLCPGFPFNQVGNSFLLMEEQRDGEKF